MGRVDTTDPTQPRFAWSGSGFVARFSGTSLSVKLSNADAFVFKAVIDGAPQAAFTVTAGQGTFPVATGLAAGMHTVALYRQTEGQQGDSQFLGVTVGGGALVDPPPSSGRLVEVVGDSISCGYGDLGANEMCHFTYGTESHWDSYEAVAARQLDADVTTIAISGHGMYRNLDGTMTTVMPKMYDRTLANDATPSWTFRAQPQAVVINLGTNDFGYMGGSDPGAPFAAAYLDFVRTLRTHYPTALIVCAIGPMVSDGYPAGAMLLTKLRSAVNSVVTSRHGEGDANIELLEFPPSGTGELGCDYHPNVAKHKSMGDALASELKSKLGW